MATIIMDNQRMSIVTETISREKKIQRQYFEKEAAAGRLGTWEPPQPETPKTLLETIGMPSFAGTFKQDPELALGTSLSKHLWTSNPGYVLREGARMASSAHQDYVWRDEEIAFMKAQGEFSKAHCKRRDEFVMYVEAAAKAHHQLGGRAAVTGTK